MAGLQSALIAAASYVLSVAFLFRLKKQRRVIRTLLLAALAQIPLYLFLFFTLRVPEESLWEGVNGFIVYGGFFYCLSHPIVLLNTSLTISLICLMDREGGIALSFGDIEKRYPYEEILQKRLSRMMLSGYLVQEGAYYHNTWKGRLYARVVARLRRFIHL